MVSATVEGDSSEGETERKPATSTGRRRMRKRGARSPLMGPVGGHCTGLV